MLMTKKRRKLTDPEKSKFVDIFNTDKKYDLVICDPPWRYRSHNKTGVIYRKYQGQADDRYSTMTIDEIAALPVPGILAEHAAVIIFVPPTHVFDVGTIFKAWGLTYTSFFMIWQKTNMHTPWRGTMRGLGHYTRGVMEMAAVFETGNLSNLTQAGATGLPLTYMPACHVYGNHMVLSDYHVLMMGRKGQAKMHLLNLDKSKLPTNMQQYVPHRPPTLCEEEMDEIRARVRGKLEQQWYGSSSLPVNIFPAVVTGARTTHSTKPQSIYDRARALFPRAKTRLEMFSRKKRPGWDVWGNDPRIVPKPDVDVVMEDG